MRLQPPDEAESKMWIAYLRRWWRPASVLKEAAAVEVEAKARGPLTEVSESNLKRERKEFKFTRAFFVCSFPELVVEKSTRVFFSRKLVTHARARARFDA